MRGACEAIAMATCRPSCGCRSSSEEMVAILSWAGDPGEGISGPARRANPQWRGAVSTRMHVTCGIVAHD
eukprot:5551866-Pyramimonas_sp.AAC.1